MARTNSSVPVLPLMGRPRHTACVSISSSAKNANRDNQIQQFSGVLISLLKVPLGQQNPVASSTSYVNNLRDESLRTPSSCWICKRLLACLSTTLCERDATFTLRSSTSSCTLNHDLLIVTRLFLKKKNISPDVITVESASVGPLRLKLVIKRLSPGKQGSELSAYKSGTANSADHMYMVRSYDVYQDLDVVSFGAGIPEIPCIPKSSHTNKCLELAKAWLEDCLMEHPKCRTHLIHQLPRRVIDVKDGLRLLVPEHGARGHWAALSHCWGKTNSLKTTLETIEAHKCQIDWESLPKTFQDAVRVARALELRYLWIDSLCIIQDDGGVDFHAEAATMCDIYRDSVLTIAASCSASDSGGFLQERKIDDPVELEKPGRLNSVHVRRAVDHSRMIRNDPIHARAWTFQETILPRRLLSFGSYETTWECETHRQCECRQIEYGVDAKTSANKLGRAAYRQYARALFEVGLPARQETSLPRRGVQYQPLTTGSTTPESLRAINYYEKQLRRPDTADEDSKLMRECVEMIHRRTISNAIQAIISTLPEEDQKQVGSILNVFEDLEPDDVRAWEEWLKDTFLNMVAITDFYRYWRRVLVPEYTRRAISKDSDRLVALQAIASDTNEVMKDRYLAGLWQGDLVNQLCWQSADGRNLPADNESPSWSWSSIRGPIVPHLSEEFEKSDFDSECWMIVVGADCSLASKNHYGRISTGSIILHASAMEVRCVKDDKTGLIGFYSLQAVSSTGHPISRVSVPLKLEFCPDTPLSSQPGSLSNSDKTERPDGKGREQFMRAVLLFIKFDENRDFCVLVCGRVSGAQESNTCRRLGIATVDHSSLELLFSNSFKDRFILI